MNPLAAIGPTAAAGAVAELQGLYGPFTFPEKLLQKIWWRGDFDRNRARTTDGRQLAVIYPGKWNHLGGPDFRSARLRIGDRAEITGDVEVHLHAGEWAAHGHARDAAYAGVVLHVVLFSPPDGQVTRGDGGREIPVVALLPLLNHDLEEYAAEEAVETLAGRPAREIEEALAPLAPGELTGLLRRHAEARLWQKMHFARLRVQRLGWDDACHQTALEILGYRFNRAPMLRIAAAFSLEAWRAGKVDPAAVFEGERSGWSLQGVRPANHPRHRLNQYAGWVRCRPDWPQQLAALAARLPRMAGGESTEEVRRRHGFAAWRTEWQAMLCGNAVPGSRFDNLVCDGFLPLLAGRGVDAAGEIWPHWYAGDVPHRLREALRQLEVFSGRANPSCHGAVQGLIGWLLEREEAARAPRPEIGLNRA